MIELVDFDVILGMDWLSKNNVKLECGVPRISFRDDHGTYFSYHPYHASPDIKIVTHKLMATLIKKGYPAYFAHVRDTNIPCPSVKDIPIVSEFQDVFP